MEVIMPHYTYMLVKRRRLTRKMVMLRFLRATVLTGLVATATGLMSFGAQSAAISQGYKPDGSLAPGALVSLEAAQNSVTAADTANNSGLFGVVVGANSTPLAVNTTNTKNMVQVTTNGAAQVFVTDLNGPIKAGDQIAPSAIQGVGMKVLTSSKVVGVAQRAFDASTAISTITVKTASGGTQVAHIGIIPVAVQVVYYTVPQKSVVPDFIQQFAVSVTGKTVSVAQLAIVLVILAAALIVVGTLMFAAVRGSIVSLGRNPLAASSIYRGTFQAVASSMAILGIAVIGAYMVLRY
jgi:hypothetical protein